MTFSAQPAEPSPDNNDARVPDFVPDNWLTGRAEASRADADALAFSDELEAGWARRHHQRRRRRWLLVWATLTVLSALVVVLVHVATASKTSRLADIHPVALPPRLGTYLRDRDARDALVLPFGHEYPQPDLIRVTAAALYRIGSRPESVAVAVWPTQLLPALSVPESQQSPVLVANALLAFTATPSSFPPGRKGGALSCARDRNALAPTTYCSWSDKLTFGAVRASGPALALPRLAALTDKLRQQVDKT